MDDELAFIEVDNLSVLTNLTINKKRECDKSTRKDKEQTRRVLWINDKYFPHNSSHNVETYPSMTF